MSFFKTLGKVAKFAASPGLALFGAAKKALSTPAGPGENYLTGILQGGGFAPGQKSQLQADTLRQLGAQTNLQRALLGERLAATPGASGTAFGDALQNQLIRGQQEASQNALFGLNRLGLDREMQAAQLLYGGQQAGAQRKAGIVGGLISGVGAVAGALSAREAKRDIKTANPDKLLKALRSVDVKKFKYKEGLMEDDGMEHTGVIADEAPAEMLADEKHISLPDSIGVLIAAVQALSDKVDSLSGGVNMKKSPEGVYKREPV